VVVHRHKGAGHEGHQIRDADVVAYRAAMPRAGEEFVDGPS